MKEEHTIEVDINASFTTEGVKAGGYVKDGWKYYSITSVDSSSVLTTEYVGFLKNILLNIGHLLKIWRKRMSKPTEFLKKHLDDKFVLLLAKMGIAEGKLWWFKDTSIVPRLDEIPLTERVEETVLVKYPATLFRTFVEVPSVNLSTIILFSLKFLENFSGKRFINSLPKFLICSVFTFPKCGDSSRFFSSVSS